LNKCLTYLLYIEHVFSVNTSFLYLFISVSISKNYLLRGERNERRGNLSEIASPDFYRDRKDVEVAIIKN